MLDTIQDLAIFKNEMLTKYTPQKTTFQIHQNQSLYCKFDYNNPKHPEKLVISLNKLDGNIYCYFRGKKQTPKISDILPHMILRLSKNAYYYNIKNLNKEKISQVFIATIKFADRYFIDYHMAIQEKKKSN